MLTQGSMPRYSVLEESLDLSRTRLHNLIGEWTMRNSRVLTLVISSVVVLLLVASLSQAAVTNATYSLTTSVGGPHGGDFKTSSSPGQISSNVQFGSSATAKITSGLTPSLFVSTSPEINGSAQANADLLYYFEVDGPAGTAVIHVSGSGSKNGSASAGITIQSSPGGQSLLSFSATPPTNPFGFSSDYNVNANQLYMVDLTTHSSGASSASLDPTTITLVSSGYTLNFSPNLVPEPATISLMLVGGLILWRKHHSA